MKINLKDKVEDTVTDFKGMVIARCVYMNGCVRCQIQPRGLDKDGKMVESEWIDEGQLVVEEKDFFAEESKKSDKEGPPGGPADKPKYMNKPN